MYEGNQNLPTWGGFSGSGLDTVSLQNGNLHLHIPLGSWKQRGGSTVSVYFTYDTPAWSRQTTIATVNNVRTYTTLVRLAEQSGGFGIVDTVGGWSVSSPVTSLYCAGVGGNVNVYQNWVVGDTDGTRHPVPINTTSGGCGGTNTKAPTSDGSGMMVDIGATPPLLTFKDGTQVQLTKNSINNFSSSGLREDPNGNQAGASTTNDTLGRVLVTEANGTGYTLYTLKDPNGSSQVYRVDWTSVAVQTNFCGGTILNNPPNYRCSEVSESSSPFKIPSKVTLPDGHIYSFSWNTNSPGELASLSLPTGATLTYTYGSDGRSCVHIITNTNGTTAPYDCRATVQSRTLTANGVASTWTYNEGTVTDPLGNDTVHVFNPVLVGAISSPNTVETQVSQYQGSSSSGKLLKMVTTDYTGEEIAEDSLLHNLRPIRETITLDSGQVTKTETDYETFTSGTDTFTRLNPTEKREYAYGGGAPGSLIRKTDYTYLHNSNSTYANLNIVDRPSSITIYDGSGNKMAQTTYEYDVYNHPGLVGFAASGAIQHDPARSTTYLTRGNQTGVSKWLNTNGSLLTTLTQYDDAGNVIASKDPLGKVTQFDYTDSWISLTGTSGGNACAPSGQTKAFSTKITNALSQITTRSYYSCTGSLGSSTDPNNLASWNVYDLFGRSVQAHAPDGGVATNCFTDAGGSGCSQSGPPFEQAGTKSINASFTENTTAVSDGLGRTTRSQINSDPQGTVYTDTSYDLIGRVASVSNPYRTGTDPTSSPGTTTYAYDALNRKVKQTDPDGSIVKTAYCGTSTLATDSSGRWRRSQTDALGRLVEVDEPNSTTATVNTNGCPAGGDPVWVTSYTFNVLDNLTNVLQNGSRPRTFTYDSLSRLVTLRTQKSAPSPIPTTPTETSKPKRMRVASPPRTGTTPSIANSRARIPTETPPSPPRTTSPRASLFLPAKILAIAPA